MIKLITDTASLFTPEEAKSLGFISNPLIININGKSYEEFTQLNDKQLLEEIKKGHLPTSSQPSLGKIMDAIEENINDDIILLSMADGLSGTYQTCLSAANHFENAKVHVINSKTLCGPQKYLVEMILESIKNNDNIDTILKMIHEKIDSIESFLLPNDFNYLKRGGRCTPIAAALGGLLKLQPVVKQTADGKRLDKFATSRSFDLAIKKIISHYEGKLDKHIIYISHAFASENAEKAKKMFEDKFKNIEINILELSCAFITQGGPGCLAIQSIKK